MIRTEKRLRLAYTLLALNLVFIWGNSLLPGELSGAISDWVKELLSHLLAGTPSAGGGGGLLRKLAHFTEFAALGMCLGWIAGMLAKPRSRALLAGILAACIDETIQVFVPDRGPSLIDVGIDSCGVLTGITLLYFGYDYLKRKHNKE
ncbi:MAG: VanZ family protein [Oscillospiraceae bacterium]|nr:VanZ family protein [Oscillospiraceae bacterium]